MEWCVTPRSLNSFARRSANYGLLDELVKSPPSQGGGYGFDSHADHHYARFDKWSKSSAFHAGVTGSNPVPSTINNRKT